MAKPYQVELFCYIFSLGRQWGLNPNVNSIVIAMLAITCTLIFEKKAVSWSCMRVVELRPSLLEHKLV